MSKKKKTTKLTKAQIEKQKELDKEIEDLELHEMSPTEIEKVVNGFSSEARTLRKQRKDVRYWLYRLKTQAEGKTSVPPVLKIGDSESSEEVPYEEFREKFESHPLFGGWRFFGITWDVAFEDPYRCVHKDKSELEEWEELVRAKFPTIEPLTGKIRYPDINVRKRVEAEIEKRKKDGRL